MNLVHIPIHADLARLVIEGKKTETRRPLKFQPFLIDHDNGGILCFGDPDRQTCAYETDYPSPYGKPGDLLLFYLEGNNFSFAESKVIESRIERLSGMDEEGLRREGMDTVQAFTDFWDKFYGESQYASHMDPFVWVTRFCKQ